MKKLNKNFVIGGSLFLLFVVFTILVKCVDVQAIGPLNSKVGFAEFNELFLVDQTSKLWDIVSDIIMAISLLVVCLFVVLGIVQLVNRKSLKKVDKNIYVVAGLYVIVAIVFVLFELVVINNRPVLEKGELVASYPSTHVLFSLVFLLSGLIQLHKFYMKNRKVLVALDIVVSVLVVMIAITRLLSGVHWITDILASILLSGALLFVYNGVLETIMNKESKDKTLE